jgi:TolA-binding protein
MIMVICFVCTVAIAQEKQDKVEEPNLAKIADDLKFQNGLLFIRLKLQDKAIEELQEYLEIYNDGIHRHEAFRELAEIYYQRFDFQKAVDVLKGLHEEFSNTEEGVEAYFRMGICYKKMGYDANAQRVFNQIIQDHPESGYAYQAQKQLDLLKILAEK